MILKYNIYNPTWTQHTEKYENTVGVLTKHKTVTFLPRLHAHCRNIDGFHYIVVEYISKHMNEIGSPNSLEACVDRATSILGMFAEMDDLGLCMMDMKPGQWMVRNDNTFVIQDVDDIVASPTKVVYDDQAKGLMTEVQHFNRMNRADADRRWKLRIFPRGTYNIRYATLNFHMIMNDLGFQWNGRTCARSGEATVDYDTFHACYKKLVAWSKSMDDDWPVPAQLVAGLESCRDRGTFERTFRQEKPWHVLPEADASTYVPPSACTRTYDNAKSGGRKFTKCQNSCCRNKGPQECYYTVDASRCS